MTVSVTEGARGARLKSDTYEFGVDGDAKNIPIARWIGIIAFHIGAKLYQREGSAYTNLLIVRNGTDLEIYVSVIPTSSVTKTDSEWYRIDDSLFTGQGSTLRISYTSEK